MITQTRFVVDQAVYQGPSPTLNAVPIPLFSSAGHVVTRNPVAVEVDGDVLRLFAATDDGPSDDDPDAVTELLVYEAQL